MFVPYFVADNFEHREKIARAIGHSIGQMHEAGVVHGDLTTSNMMIKNDADSSIVFIDFGLASTQPNIEDNAVDLYVLERAFISTHPGCESMVFISSMQVFFFCIFDAYIST